MASPDLLGARFVARPNRFVIVAELDDGQRVRAYLPNTGRLEHLASPGTRFLLRRDGAAPRRTEFTATRAWDECWVALNASLAPRLLVDWIRADNPFPGFGPVDAVRSEVVVGSHRLDLLLTGASGDIWVEVKSGGRAHSGVALLSKTPSARGVAHLATLAELAARGEQAAVSFVIQRDDARELRIGGDADPSWIGAVRAADAAGVVIAAFGCDVTEDDVRIARVLPVGWDDRTGTEQGLAG